jgi:type II secretory pathway pseudopilin PulG
MTSNIKNRGLGCRRQRGLTLIELVLGVSVAVFIAGIAIATYQQAQSSGRGYSAANGLVALTSSARAMYPNSAYTGANPAPLAQSGTLPSSMVSGATLVGAFGGNILVVPVATTAGASTGLSVRYPQVPKSECARMIQAVSDSFLQVRLGTISAGTFTPDAAYQKNYDITPAVPLNAATLITACNTRERHAIEFVSQ